MNETKAKGVLGHPLNYFDRIQVINLRSRPDRRRELRDEFERVGFDVARIDWFDAVKPEDRGDFDSIGARGCFMSHLSILRQNSETPPARLLILEDDVSFATDFLPRLTNCVAQLQVESWDVFYGGGRLAETGSLSAELSVVPQTVGIQCTHFVAFSGHVIPAVCAYLEAQLTRPAGDPAGGPMHVDGSYSWARNALNLRTLIANPDIAYQRSSRSDIAAARWWDRVAGFRELSSGVRALKNSLGKAR